MRRVPGGDAPGAAHAAGRPRRARARQDHHRPLQQQIRARLLPLPHQVPGLSSAHTLCDASGRPASRATPAAARAAGKTRRRRRSAQASCAPSWPGWTRARPRTAPTSSARWGPVHRGAARGTRSAPPVHFACHVDRSAGGLCRGEQVSCRPGAGPAACWGARVSRRTAARRRTLAWWTPRSCPGSRACRSSRTTGASACRPSTRGRAPAAAARAAAICEQGRNVVGRPLACRHFIQHDIALAPRLRRQPACPTATLPGDARAARRTAGALGGAGGAAALRAGLRGGAARGPGLRRGPAAALQPLRGRLRQQHVRARLQVAGRCCRSA